MMPVVWTIPGLNWDIPSYGLMLMIALLVSILWAARRAARSGADPDVVLNCGFIAVVGGVVGARGMFVWHNWEQFARRGSALDVALAVIDVRKGGLEVYGGVVLTTLSVIVYLLWARQSVRWYLDIVAPSTALGMAIGRIGCFLNGCCFGGVCDQPWGVTYPYGTNPALVEWSKNPEQYLPPELICELPGRVRAPIPREVVFAPDSEIEHARELLAPLTAKLAELQEKARTGAGAPERPSAAAMARELETLQDTPKKRAAADKFLPLVANMQRYKIGSIAQLRDLARHYRSGPVHPVQLYSTIALGLIALLLNSLYWRRTRDGQIICTLLIIESLTRFVIEYIRPDNPVDVHLPLGFATLDLTISQSIAIVLFAAGLLGLYTLRFLPPRAPAARLWEPPEETPAGRKQLARRGA
jgi:phosphatidylglycerol:prolipoprotein diacylglycerol transferase